MFTVAPISSRNQFGKLLNDHGLVGEIVEVGSHRGEFTRIILDTWLGKVIHCIDPWSIPPGYEYQAQKLWGGQSREEDYQAFIHLVGKGVLPQRVMIHRCTSLQAQKLFKSNSLDFVYVDGDHRYNHVLSDMKSWWSKLRVGGILACHDIVCPGEVKGAWGREIQRALRDWIDTTFMNNDDVCDNEPEVHLVVEEGGLPWSAYVVKVDSGG